MYLLATGHWSPTIWCVPKLQGHFKNANTTPKSKLAEFREFYLEKELGDEVTVAEVFAEGQKVMVTGT